MNMGTRNAAVSAAMLLLSATSAFADLPIEHPGVAEIRPDNGHRLYIADKTPPAHAVDSKIRIIDGDDFSVLGQLTNGSFGTFAISADRRTLFDATSFFSRGDHGTRTDVLEYYDTTTLKPRGETILLSKRAMSNQYSSFLVESAGAKYLIAQNANPASSISIVDLATRSLLSEIPTAGCFGIYASRKNPGRFSTLCGDGAALTVDFDSAGKEIGRKRSAPLFDPERDALFISAVRMDDKTIFISFLGNVHVVDFSGEVATQETPWTFLGAKEQVAHWRPGGYSNIAYSSSNGQLYLGMHPDGEEGSHKVPATEIWKIDVAKHQIVGRTKSDGANYLQVSKELHPLLFAVNVTADIQGSISRYDGDTLKLLATSKPDLLEGGGPLWVE